MLLRDGIELLKLFLMPVNIAKQLIFGQSDVLQLNYLEKQPYFLGKTFWTKFKELYLF